MPVQQDFRFRYDEPEDVRSFLRTFAGSMARIDERADDFFVFSAPVGLPAFSVDFWLQPWGLRSLRSGNYFEFLGFFLEAITGHFGPLIVEDSSVGDP
jgi:hypothetical protein